MRESELKWLKEFLEYTSSDLKELYSKTDQVELSFLIKEASTAVRLAKDFPSGNFRRWGYDFKGRNDTNLIIDYPIVQSLVDHIDGQNDTIADLGAERKELLKDTIEMVKELTAVHVWQSLPWYKRIFRPLRK